MLMGQGFLNILFSKKMTNDRHLIQIRNGVYLLCGIAVVTLIAGIGLNIHLTNRSLKEMKTMAVEDSSEQSLINELNNLLETNNLDALISRCESEIEEKPLSRSGHYYLGLAYYHSGDQAKSRKYLVEALRIDPTWKVAIEPYLENFQAEQGSGQQPPDSSVSKPE